MGTEVDRNNDPAIWEQSAEDPSVLEFVPGCPGSTSAMGTGLLAEQPPAGLQEDLTETPLFLTTSLAQLKDALDMIPVENKQEYMEAAKLAPNLIKSESHPIPFLRCEDFNPWKAAQRLVAHWAWRKQLFKKRWLLPLKNETGAGALLPDDISLLRAGWLSLVIPQDKKLGRFYLIDHGRYKGHSLDCFPRVAFYLGTVAQDITSQTVGVTSIRLISSKDHGGEPQLNLDLYRTAQKCWKLSKEALPFRLKRVIFLKEEAFGKGNMVHFFLGRVGSSIMSLLSSDAPVTVPVPSKEEALDTLVDMGVPRDMIPVSHGGTWTYDHMFDWREVKAKENDMGQFVNVPWLAESRAAPDEDRTKAVKALYARRAYHKRRVKQNQQQEEIERLREENERLKKDNAFFESLIQRANNVIAEGNLDEIRSHGSAEAFDGDPNEGLGDFLDGAFFDDLPVF